MYSSKIAGFLALVAALCFIALVALQAMEIMHYSAEPTLWPVSVSQP